MNVEQARQNMLNNQIRACDVLDENLLTLFEDTPRECFVPKAFRALAFADTNIPIGHGQVMMTPFDEGQLLQALAIQATDSILEIGTGTGYLTALLAKLGNNVTSVDMFAEFTQSAATKFKEFGITNVTLATGDASQGWDEKSHFDVIVITGSLPFLPQAYKRALKPNGRLFAVLGHSPVMKATLLHSEQGQQFNSIPLYETDLLPLINAVDDASFSF